MRVMKEKGLKGKTFLNKPATKAAEPTHKGLRATIFTKKKLLRELFPECNSNDSTRTYDGDVVHKLLKKVCLWCRF